MRTGTSAGRCLAVTRSETGRYEFRSTIDGAPDITLVFDHGEVEAFHAGIIEHDWLMSDQLTG